MNVRKTILPRKGKSAAGERRGHGIFVVQKSIATQAP
jgi:hypothetical protein